MASITVPIGTDLKQMLDGAVQRDGTTINQFVREAIVEKAARIEGTRIAELEQRVALLEAQLTERQG